MSRDKSINTRHIGDGTDEKLTHSEGNPATEANMSADIFNIPDNIILQGIAGYPEQSQDDLRWFVGYIRQVKHNKRSAATELLDCDWSTIVRVLQGKYPGKIDNFMSKIQDVRKKAALNPNTEFIETLVTKRIWSAMDLARDLNIIVHIVGGSGRSKTWTAKEWCLHNNHGRAVYIDTPVVGGMRPLMEEIAKKKGIGIGSNVADLRRRLISSFDAKNILVVDEAARLLPSSDKPNKSQPLDFLRRLHDVSGCGLVLITTKIFTNEMVYGKSKAYMEQIFGRIEETVEIPDQILKDEIKAICDTYTQEADENMYKTAYQIANKFGKIRILFSLIKAADLYARNKGQQLNSNHLKAALAQKENRHIWPEK